MTEMTKGQGSNIEIKHVEQNITPITRLLKVLANENRLKTLCHLQRGEKCVGELMVLAGLAQSVTSQHLALMRQENIVRFRRDVRTIFYSLNCRHTAAILRTLNKMEFAEYQKPKKQTRRKSTSQKRSQAIKLMEEV